MADIVSHTFIADTEESNPTSIWTYNEDNKQTRTIPVGTCPPPRPELIEVVQQEMGAQTEPVKAINNYFTRTLLIGQSNKINFTLLYQMLHC